MISEKSPKILNQCIGHTRMPNFDPKETVCDLLSSEVTFVKASVECGHVELEDIVAAIRPNTCMVSIMMANNETGVIQV